MSIAAEALTIGLVFGVIFAVYVARRSLREETVYGGALAQVFHFLGAVSFCATIPTVIAALILRGGFGTAFPLGIGTVAAAFVFLILFALVEYPVRSKIEPVEEVWTEEKARASGM